LADAAVRRRLSLASLGHMKPLSYMTGEPVFAGDVVKLGALDGVVSGVLQPDSPEWDDYGGVSIETVQCGAIRLEHVNEDLVLVTRRVSQSPLGQPCAPGNAGQRGLFRFAGQTFWPGAPQLGIVARPRHRSRQSVASAP